MCLSFLREVQNSESPDLRWGAHEASCVDWLAMLAARPTSYLALISSWFFGFELSVFASTDYEDKLATCYNISVRL